MEGENEKNIKGVTIYTKEEMKQKFANITFLNPHEDEDKYWKEKYNQSIEARDKFREELKKISINNKKGEGEKPSKDQIEELANKISKNKKTLLDCEDILETKGNAIKKSMFKNFCEKLKLENEGHNVIIN